MTAPATEIVRLNPRSADGSLAAGWSATNETADTCTTGGERSYYSLTADVFTCGANAYARRACWAMNDGTAVCLHTAFSKKVARFPVANPVQVTSASRDALALAFELADGVRCEVVTHAHPRQRSDNGVGRYECTDGRAVLEDGLGGKVVDQSKPQWSVRVAREFAPAKTVQVKRAWFASSTPFTLKAPSLDRVQTANAFLRAVGANDRARALTYGSAEAWQWTQFGTETLRNITYSTCVPLGASPWTCVTDVGEHNTDNVWQGALTVTMVDSKWKVTNYRPHDVEDGWLGR